MGAILFGSVLNLLGNVLFVPLFLSHWGNTTYGEWMALSAVVAYLSTMDLGMNMAAVNEMTMAYAKQDLRQYRSVQSSALAFYVLVTLVILAVAAVACIFVPFPVWLGIKSIPSHIAAIVSWLLAARLMLQLLAVQVWGIYRSMGDLARFEWIWNTVTLAGIVITVLVLFTGGNVLELAAWGIVPVIVITAIVWGLLLHSNPQLLPRQSEASLAAMRRLIKPSLSFGLITVAILLAYHAPVVLVSASLGGAAVALLVGTRTLTMIMGNVIGMLTNAFWPEVTRLHAIGAEAELRIGNRCLSAATVVSSAALAGALWFNGASVIRTWTNGKLEPDVVLLRLFLIALLLQAPWLACSLISTATNRNRRLSFLRAGSAILTVVATAILLPHFGIRAVPIAVILGEAIACYHFVLKDTCRIIRDCYWSFAVRIWATTTLSFCAATVVAWIIQHGTVGPEPLRWFETGTSTMIVCVVIGWFIALRAQERSWLVGLLQLTWDGHSPMAEKYISSSHGLVQVETNLTDGSPTNQADPAAP